jgi:hypothetical protein
MQQSISPATAVSGGITLPGDNSVSHRCAMISAIAKGTSRIHNYSTGADCGSSLGCMRALGVEIEVSWTDVTVHGRGLEGLRAPSTDWTPPDPRIYILCLQGEAKHHLRDRTHLRMRRVQNDAPDLLPNR